MPLRRRPHGGRRRSKRSTEGGVGLSFDGFGGDRGAALGPWPRPGGDGRWGGMKIELANRIRELPPYLFAHIDALKQEERKKGRDLIDLGIGDPDLPTHPHIVEALATAAREGRNHRYPSYVGMLEMRQAAATFMNARFGVEVDPAREVICVIGSKEAIAHFPFA